MSLHATALPRVPASARRRARRACALLALLAGAAGVPAAQASTFEARLLPVGFEYANGRLGQGTVPSAGQAVAVSAGRIAVAATGSLASTAITDGVVGIYEQIGGQWAEVARVRPPQSPRLEARNFGFSIDLEGDTLVVGAPYGFVGGTPAAGHAWVVRRGAEGGWNTVAELAAPVPQENATFGWSVELSGDRIAVSAPRAAAGGGSVHVFERNLGGSEAWGLAASLSRPGRARFGESLALSDGTLVAFSRTFGGTDPRLHVLERDAGGTWNEVALLGTPLTVSRPPALALEGDLLVASSGSTIRSNAAGRVIIWERDASGVWPTPVATSGIQNVTFVNQTNHEFGTTCAIDGDRIVTGGRQFGPGPPVGGALHVFERSGNTWDLAEILTIPDASIDDEFGSSIAVEDGLLVAGAPQSGLLSYRAGAAYVWRLP